MKKGLSLFLSSLFVSSVGLGLLYSSFKSNDVKRVDAKDDISYVTLDDKGTYKLGSFPQNIVTDISADTIKNNGTKKETMLGPTFYIYNNKKYSIIDNAEVDQENVGSHTLSNGEMINDYNNTQVVIEFNDVEWQLLKKDTDNTAYLISTRILAREIYDFPASTHTVFDNSYLYNYLNDGFKPTAFSYEDLKNIVGQPVSMDDFKVTIPTIEDVGFDTYEDKGLKQASDFAILNNLSSAIQSNHGTGVPYLNAGYWTSSFSSEQDRIKVVWSKIAFTNCLMNDPKIGVRPVIHVNYKEGSSGGGSGSGTDVTPTKPSSNGGGNAPLGFGIAFTILGAGGLIAFFIYWSKKHKDAKPPIWLIAALAGSLVISVAGLGCLAGGMTGGGDCFTYGYYVQSGGQHSGNGIVQVGYTAWLFKSDGTCSYCSYLEDTENASDYSPDNYMQGTYTVSGSKLTIDIPEHYINNFGTVGGIETYTIKNCKYLYRYGVEAYHFVRGE